MNIRTNPENVNAPVIAGVEITTDAEGRFNLNALHKASGTDEHKRPSKWIAAGPTKELIAELESQSPPAGFGVLNVVRGGNAPGTFAAEELAVSYAGWLSPSFQLEVNRTFIDYRTGKLEPIVRPVAQDKISREVRLQMREFGKFGKLMGLEGNQLALSVSRSVEKVTGVSPMGIMGITHIDAPEPEALLNVSSVGIRVGGMGAVAVNKALTLFGFQEKHRDYKDRPYYEPTDKGLRSGAVMQDTDKKHDNGTPVRQLRWASGIVDALTVEMEAAQ